MESPSRPGLRRILLSVVILAAIFAFSIEGLQPPAPKPFNAPAGQFSASRALDTLRRVLGSDVPHPVGSPADDAVRDRIVAELTKLGYQPQIQPGFTCSDLGECSAVNNVLARLDSPEDAAASAGAVLLASHYDSVPAGPGDSDDGTGVAIVLETARALKSLPTLRHSVIFLIDEGEEAGLLGARAFVDSDPWAKEVRAAVNLDARGTSGPSLMFETGSANDWDVRLYAKAAARPVTSSIFYTAYKYIPNDTDFTVFKAAGYDGLNFAFIGDEVHYHTPLDNSANISPATLQHQGDNALASIVALADSDLSPGSQEGSVFFDLFGRVAIHWRSRKTLKFAIFILVLLLLEIVGLTYREFLSRRQLLSGLLAWFITVFAAGASAIALRLVIRGAGGAPVNWIAHPLPIEISFWSLAVAVVIIVAVWSSRSAGFWGLWSGVWIWWGAVAVALACWMPGLGYVFVVPAGVAALAGLPAVLSSKKSVALPGVAAILPLAAAGIVGFAPAILLYDGLGNRGLPLVGVTVGLIVTPLAPLCADLRDVAGLRSVAFVWVPILTTAVAAFGAVVLPAYSAKAPERVNFEYWQDADSGQARWVVQPDSGRLPEPIRLATAFRKATQDTFPWEMRPSFVADAPNLGLSAPTFTILESNQLKGMRTYKTLLRSERGAPSAAVFFPPDSGVGSVEMGGQPLGPGAEPIQRYLNGWSAYRCPAIPAAGIEIDFSLPIGKPVEVWALDRTYGLPHEGDFLLMARPLTAVPSQDGDVTVVTRHVELLP